MTSTVTYNNDLRTTCLHLRSNDQIITDAPTDNNGKGQAFSPTDLVATALASCMLTVMGIRANHLDINLTNTKATVEKIMASSPRRIQEIKIRIQFPENDWNNQIENSLKITAINCPVAKSLHSDIQQSVEFLF